MAGEEVEVFRGQGGELERAFYEAALREEGITCVAKSSGAVSQHPLTVGPMAEFSIFVAAEDENRARELIQGLQVPLESVEEDDLDDKDTFSGVLRKSKSTAQQRKIFRIAGFVFLAATLYFLVPFREASIWGILSLIMAAILLAGSRAP